MKTIEKDGFVLEINDDGGDCLKILRTAKPIKTAVLTIPDNVTEIADKAFWDNRNIEKVILPKTLHTIGAAAFGKMPSLREINLENVKRIGNHAFEYSDALEKVSLKCGSMGERAFCLCEGLTEAEVDCEIIADSAFEYCKSLQKVVLKNTRRIGNEAFSETEKLNEIILPPELEEIGDSAFYRSGIKALTIPKTVRRIGREIADYHTTEIHIYDNIETDIRRENDISPAGYILYVHSAETDEIKYAVPVFGYAADPEYGYSEHDRIVDMFVGGVNFDFKKFDNYFDKISGDDELYKFNAGRLRLKYGYELDEDTRRGYEEQLARLAPSIAEYCIGYYGTEKPKELFDPEFYNYLSIEQMLPLIDLSAKKHLTELTAFMMQICDDKRG